MSVELLYTSAVQGLKQGSRGFCTVLSTTGMPLNLANRLESLSAYRHVFPPNSPDAAQNPVNYSHIRITVGGRPLSILSRISDYGIDYSQRTNKLAHHVVLEGSDLVPAGPAWVMMQPAIMRSQWDGQCSTPPTGPTVPPSNQAARVCLRWSGICTDAGWGGVVAEAFAQPPGKPLWIIFTLAQSAELLGMINESIALLPVDQRWQATFSTYATNLPPDADCKVRCVLAGTDDARLAPARGKVIDLSKPLPPIAPSSVTSYIHSARNGTAMSGISSAAVPSLATPALPKPSGELSPIPEVTGELFDVDESDLSPVGREVLRSQRTSERKLTGGTSAPPAIKGKSQTPTSSVVTVKMHSSSKLKWALVGVSVAASLLLITTVALVTRNISIEVSQISDLATGKQEQREENDLDQGKSSVPSNGTGEAPLTPNFEGNLSPELPLAADGVLGKAEDEKKAGESPNVPPIAPQVDQQQAQSDVEVPTPTSEMTAGAHTTSKTDESAIGDTTSTSVAKLTNDSGKDDVILIGEISLKKLMSGDVWIRIVVEIPKSVSRNNARYAFSREEIAHPFHPFDHSGKRSEIKTLKPIGEPFAFDVVLDPQNKELTDLAGVFKSNWEQLGAKVTAWQQWFRDHARDQVAEMKLAKLEDPKPNESLTQFRERLDVFEKDVSEIGKKINLKKQSYAEKYTQQLAEQNFSVFENQLKQIGDSIEKLRMNLDAISNTRAVFETGTILFVSSEAAGKLVNPRELKARYTVGKQVENPKQPQHNSTKADTVE